MPDSTGYIAGPTLYAFLLRGGYAFQFMSTGGEGEAPFEQRVVAFKDLLSRFEPRSLYQVPNKAGVCIPHGFIADDGKGPFNADVSFRYADSPGVIYTLSTGIVGERNDEPNDPLIEATARATVSAVIGNSYGRKLKVLGPKSVKIGARGGLLGGISTAEGAPGYSVYAGVGGVPGSQVLPHISLNMRSFDKQTAPDDVKVDPPPFEQSLQRFEQTLSSARTRRTGSL
ncbi:T6SS immunity protein Tli4 family protein [Ideonella paludis]|uniref:T6SS immunity protein Tli4 family protein n=1 Tax=Ideonella paludis TaxID=1233411 RepID=UPI00362B5595